MKHKTLLPVCLALFLAGIRVAVAGVSALADGPLGLHDSQGLQLKEGPCPTCPAPRQALWYFQGELVATPVAGAPVAGFDKSLLPQADVAQVLRDSGKRGNSPLPAVVWLGSPEVLPWAQLDESGKTLSVADGARLDFAIVPKLATNLSYFNDASQRYFAGRPLRLRGKTESDEHGRQRFVARTVWPLDFSLTQQGDTTSRPLGQGESLMSLVQAHGGGAQQAFERRLLWQRQAGVAQQWDGHAVLAVMLNGAQGDDDEAHGGHFAMATGRFRQDGDWSRWLVYNFYNLDSIGEKGIVAAPTPMDKYLLDLNNGQSWYRPSYMLVAVLKQDRAARLYQDGVERLYNRFYRHDFTYQHSRSNCAGISVDTLRTLGWNLPLRGHEPMVKAIGAYLYVAATSGSLADGRKIYDYLLEESTRLYPASSFDALGQDLLALVQGTVSRPLSQYETMLREDVEAIYYVRIPQIPSSRAFGLAPVASFDDYMKQAPADRSQWKILPAQPRPFPDALRDGPTQEQAMAPMPWPVVLTLALLTAVMLALGLGLRRWLKRGRT